MEGKIVERAVPSERVKNIYIAGVCCRKDEAGRIAGGCGRTRRSLRRNEVVLFRARTRPLAGHPRQGKHRRGERRPRCAANSPARARFIHSCRWPSVPSLNACAVHEHRTSNARAYMPLLCDPPSYIYHLFYALRSFLGS